VAENDANILLLGHVTGPSDAKNDRIIARKIRDKMEKKESAFVIGGDYAPGELKGIISRCDVFMGSRMHSNIAALSSCVPTLAIGYSHKTSGIMSLFGVREYVLNIDKLSETKLQKTLNLLYENKQNIQDELNKKLPEVTSESSKNIKIIEKIIEGKK
jgi:colanic acid/amylovoran biosynthesis protein